MWKASDEDSTVWLFGSVHFLPEEAHWFSPALEHALESVDLFYYEASVDKAARTRAARFVLRHGFNLRGKNSPIT